jgi:hypothetical protein
MLQAVQLPAGITNLDTSLAEMNRDTLTHFGLVEFHGADLHE